MEKKKVRKAKPSVASPKPPLPYVCVSTEGTLASKTGTWRFLTPKYQNKIAPCSEACPAGEDVESVMVLAGEEDYPGAWDKIMEENPLPGVCGRVCFHPCEAACSRNALDEPVSINALERFIGDAACVSGRKPDAPVQKRHERVAVIGSGPAGLSCAYHLARMGYGITLFEAEKKLGGVLRYGIPGYRLPRDVLDREIERIVSLGVEVMTEVRVGRDLAWEDLKKYAAVFAATGAWESLPLNIPGEEAAGVMSGLAFLKKVHSGEKADIGERVAVIGGGNTAMDAARTAVRLGAKVWVVYRRTKEEMPAWAEEVADAGDENVTTLFLTSPVRIVTERGKVSAIECIGNILGDPGKDGRRVPLPLNGSNFSLKIDTVISAIGEVPDMSFLPAGLQRDSRFLSVDGTGSTALKGVFGGGDMTAQPRTVAFAIGSGKRAAMAIDAYLTGNDAADALDAARVGNKGALSMSRYRSRDGQAQDVIAPSDLNLAYFKREKRTPKGKLPLSGRCEDFAEVNLGLSREDALREAKRCFNCGVCNLCHNCLIYCPDLAVSARPDKQGYEINYDYCKGCCLCVEECPRGAISVEVGK